MNAQAYQFEDNKYGAFHQTEDAFSIQGYTICVADGITRDPLHIENFTGMPIEELLRDYPYPSLALVAAEVFCDSFIATLSSHLSVRDAMIAANTAIAKLNRELKVDYLVNDYAACVASGARIDGLTLHWVSIGDCFTAILDSAGNLKFQSPHGTLNWEQYEKAHPGNWADPVYRKRVRSEFRNNPRQIIDGNLVSYGALTGEHTAEQFVVYGTEKLEKGDTVLCFSDGFFHTVHHPDFYRALSSGREAFMAWQQSLAERDYARYGHERTLVLARIV